MIGLVLAEAITFNQALVMWLIILVLFLVVWIVRNAMKGEYRFLYSKGEIMGEPGEDPHLSKAKIERANFEHFLEAANSKKNFNTIRKPEDPNMDFECITKDGQIVEFEITELIDQEFANERLGQNSDGGPMRRPFITESVRRHILEKKPNTDYPKELVIFIKHQPMDIKGKKREKWISEIKEMIGESIYRRIWLFNKWDSDVFSVSRDDYGDGTASQNPPQQ